MTCFMFPVSSDNLKIAKICPVEWEKWHSLHNSFLPVVVTFLIIMVSKYQKETQLKGSEVYFDSELKENS